MDRTMYDDQTPAEDMVPLFGDIGAHASGTAYGEGWWREGDPAAPPEAADDNYVYTPPEAAGDDSGWGR